VPPEAVELDEVGEGERAVFGRGGGADEVLHELGIAPLHHVRDALHREDVADLADGVDGAARAGDPVAERGRGRGDGVVVAVAGAAEGALGPREGPGDDAAHAHGVEPRREIAAERQEPVEPEGLFMRRDLEDAVGGGVADGPAGPQVRGALLLDDHRARGVAVAEDAIGPGEAADLGREIGRKGRVGVGEVVPVPWHRHAREFPVPRWRVLAARHLGRRAPEADRRHLEPRRLCARREPHRGAETQRVEVRDTQGAAAPVLRPARRAGLRDMGQRVGAGVGHPVVEEGVGIGRAAAAHRIHHDEEGARHQAILSRMSGGASAGSSEIV
jgi:hypothetical protein